MTIIVTNAGYSIEYKETDTKTDTTTERTIVVNSGGTEWINENNEPYDFSKPVKASITLKAAYWPANVLNPSGAPFI